MRLLLLAAPLALLACTPVAMEDAGEGVTVRYFQHAAAGIADPARVAERHCAEEGRTAELIRTDVERHGGVAYAHYACVDAPAE
jgi:hypothetical protein